MKNSQIMLVVVLVLAGLVALLVYDRARTPQTPGEAVGNAIERISNDIGEAGEEIRDEIDDHTTGR